ncbi:hypothetical protein HGRIS_004396 [Hohenbuehelia grisea]|uniref:Pyridoxal phosphate homeostasis protein n=1 Tax=Hohenbuehelia grisea TaxID=104357 RepID=A0ABR3JC12_9AGAR
MPVSGVRRLARKHMQLALPSLASSPHFTYKNPYLVSLLSRRALRRTTLIGLAGNSSSHNHPQPTVHFETRNYQSSMSATSNYPCATLERSTELSDSLEEIRKQVELAWTESKSKTAEPADASAPRPEPTLIAVSKYKPASDIMACYAAGQRDFGENYVQELVDKAKDLPLEIRWHFIGTLQSNKSKILAAIPNLHCLQTLTSIKAARALNAARTLDVPRVNVMIQVNTSGEDAKSGLPPLTADTKQTNPSSTLNTDVTDLARFVIKECSRLRLVGLMTIGSIAESRSEDGTNHDFERLRETRDVLHGVLGREFPQAATKEDGETWGESGRLLLSMGMSSDFEVAIRAGSDVVRVGTGIFGSRPKKHAAE